MSESLKNHNNLIIKIGVTGGIGSGKNVAAQEFNKLGAQIIDTDSLVHGLYREDKQLIREIVTLFGNSVIDENGNINRVNLAEIVFYDKISLERLDKLVHPKVKYAMDEQINKLRKINFKGCAVFLVPLLIEAAMVDDFDVVVVVTADRKVRLQRVIKRDNLTENEVELRIKSQIEDNKRIKYADYIIDNNGSLSEMKKQVKEIYNNIIRNNPQKPTHLIG
ncbi:dephospho-CoA kinase [bacterium]|nr:dephospho-CoA kinase [bacterium]